jgi:acyl carrier protein
MPALTAERFVPDPCHDGERLYRTGDRARLLPDGRLEYLGRLDLQLKIRGWRIEPAEVEDAISRHPAVAACAVAARPGADGRPRLVAWVVPAGPRPPTLEELRAFLGARLPSGFMPDVICLVDELPVGPHGKLDRRALPDPGADAMPLRPAHGSGAGPRNVVERRLAELWSEVLGVDEPSIGDDFFALGGHSLLATRLQVRVRATFGVDISLIELFEGALTIERLAGLVQSGQVAQMAESDIESVMEWMSGLSDGEVAALLGADGPTAEPPEPRG